MWRFAKVIVQNGSLVLFVILQCICLLWVVKYNQTQQKIYLHSYQLLASSVSSKYQSAVNYFQLRKQYDSLVAENARLLELRFNSKQLKDSSAVSSGYSILYQVVPARVVNNSLDKRNNMLSLDKGGKDGIAPGMGVITPKGLVGIVTDTTAHYSLVMSLLHSATSVSARLKRGGFFGPLVWRGRDPSTMNLEAIQKYADVRLGDTIVTSGYSVVFPKDLLIGVVRLHHIEEGSFTYDIDVALSQPMVNLDQVYVIINPGRTEKEELEKKAMRYE